MDRSARKHSRKKSDHQDSQMKNRYKQKRSLDNLMASSDERRRNKGMCRNAEINPPPNHVPGPDGIVWQSLLPAESEESDDDYIEESLSPSPLSPSGLLNASNIKMMRLMCGYEDRYPVVEEVSESLLTVTHPKFCAKATFEIPPLPSGSSIKIGWIQVIPKGVMLMKYEDELLSLEIPEMVLGDEHMVLDSSGKMIPWFDEDQVKFVNGPTTASTFASLKLSDRPELNIPMASYKADIISKQNLNFVYRKNRFYSYLVLKNLHEDNYHIIKALSWYVEVSIGVNPNKPLGERVEFIGPCLSADAFIMPDWFTPPLEKFALQRPIANDCQILMSRLKGKKPLIRTHPTETTANLNYYVSDTEDYTDVVSNITLENFLKRFL